MKRVIAWFAGLVGIAALGRWLAHRTHRPAEVGTPADAPAAEAPPAPQETDPAESDPAEELRRRLAEARGAEQEPAAAPAEETLEERRARVHAKAREAIDAMGDDGTVG